MPFGKYFFFFSLTCLLPATCFALVVVCINVQSGFIYFCCFPDFILSVESIRGSFTGYKWRDMPNKSQFQCKSAVRVNGLLDW